jgi:hypothetical protein
MKVTLETGQMEIWVFSPCPAIIYEPKDKSIELGLYFLKYFLSLKIKIK